MLKRIAGCSRVTILIACLAAMAHTAIAANPATVLELPSIEVVSTTPIPGLGTPLQQIPGNVQTISAKKIDEQHASDFSEMLNQNMGSVSISDTQSSPVQMDVNFRGFTASPVLGTPQGLSVFVDGVRVNEAFGDVVNWDLLPKNAISTISIMPGSNPVFGLNTLGGAISVNTKSGFDFPGTGPGTVVLLMPKLVATAKRWITLLLPVLWMTMVGRNITPPWSSNCLARRVIKMIKRTWILVIPMPIIYSVATKPFPCHS